MTGEFMDHAAAELRARVKELEADNARLCNELEETRRLIREALAGMKIGFATTCAQFALEDALRVGNE